MSQRLYICVVTTLVMLTLVSGCNSGEDDAEARFIEGDHSTVASTDETESPNPAPATPTPKPSPTFQPTFDSVSDEEEASVSALPMEEPQVDLRDGWSLYQHDEHSYTVSYPQSWTAQRGAGDSLLITNSDLNIPRGSGNFLPAESVDLFIVPLPYLDPPLVQGEAVSVGVSGHVGEAYHGDPWGYINWGNEIRIYYAVGLTGWMIYGQFAELVSEDNPLVYTFYEIVGTLHHDTSVVPDVSETLPQYYDSEWAYRERVTIDAQRLWLSFGDYEQLIMDEGRQIPDWETKFSETLYGWGMVYEEFRYITPPPTYEWFHSRYVHALSWNAGSSFVLFVWNEYNQQWFEWTVAQVMLRTADELISGAFQYWPTVDPDQAAPHEHVPIFVSHYPQRSLKGPPLMGSVAQTTYQEFGVDGVISTVYDLLTESSGGNSVDGQDRAAFTLEYLAEYVQMLSGTGGSTGQ